MSDERDELIAAQKEVIKILFEVVRLLQENNGLDEEYLSMATSDMVDAVRLDKILELRDENARKAGELLKRLAVRQ